jgi:uncharacterized protein YceH (UPF0502 family)
MLVQLSALQARVIGALIEKEITTPEQYPLSLNALTLACNQKSNREPVMQLTEAQVQDTIEELNSKNLLFEVTGSGSRVVKYKHRFCNTEFSSLQLSAQQLAIICVLLLRGPQTPGELRTRTNRLASFTNVDEVESVLNTLLELNTETLVKKLPREPGKRESRFVQLFSADAGEHDNNVELVQNDSVEEGLSAVSQGHNPVSTSPDLADALARIEQLEQQVASLQEQVQLLTDVIEN